jgi:hypothetical protein
LISISFGTPYTISMLFGGIAMLISIGVISDAMRPMEMAFCRGQRVFPMDAGQYKIAGSCKSWIAALFIIGVVAWRLK